MTKWSSFFPPFRLGIITHLRGYLKYVIVSNEILFRCSYPESGNNCPHLGRLKSRTLKVESTLPKYHFLLFLKEENKAKYKTMRKELKDYFIKEAFYVIVLFLYEDCVLSKVAKK